MKRRTGYVYDLIFAQHTLAGHPECAERLAAILGYPLRPSLILLEPEAPGGYRRDWQPRFGGFGPERHRGYAVQWFALAATLVILYLAAHARRSPPSE